MLPEISHRCPSCGVSVRERDALFCPDCGKPLAEKPAAEPKHLKSDDSEPVSAKPEGTQDSGEVAELANRDDESRQNEGSRSPQPPIVVSPKSARASSAEPRTIEGEPSTQPAHRRRERTRERLQRASEVARGVTRGVIEEPAKRVEKIRHVSTVVIEEASYDPSLRFVIVALGLFIVFVVLLVLSKVMG